MSSFLRIDRERASGFLIPSTSSSTIKGRSVSETFYWAINRSADATFTGDYFTARGPAGTASFRAVPNKNSRLEISTFFVHDKLGQGGQSARIFDYTDLGNNYRGVLDLNLVSSLVFRQVFEDGLSLISSPIEHSQAFITRTLSRRQLQRHVQTHGSFLSDQPTVVTQRTSGLRGRCSGPARSQSCRRICRLETGVAGLSRRDAAITTPALVGRFDFHPVCRSSSDSDLGFPVESSASGFARRHIRIRYRQPIGQAVQPIPGGLQLVGPVLERDYGRWRHVVEPSVDYNFVGGADRFRDTVVVDDVDLVTNTRQVEYAITNQLFTTREIINWRIAQDYYFDPTFGGAIRPGTFGTRLRAADGADRLRVRRWNTPNVTDRFQYAHLDHPEHIDGHPGRLRSGNASLRWRRYQRRFESWADIRQHCLLLSWRQRHTVSQQSVQRQDCLR